MSIEILKTLDEISGECTTAESKEVTNKAFSKLKKPKSREKLEIMPDVLDLSSRIFHSNFCTIKQLIGALLIFFMTTRNYDIMNSVIRKF